MPLGVWVARTADSVLLTCWPPLPPARQVWKTMSAGLPVSCSARFSGSLNTPIYQFLRGWRGRSGLSHTHCSVPCQRCAVSSARQPERRTRAERMPCLSAVSSSTCAAAPACSASRRICASTKRAKMRHSAGPWAVEICRVAAPFSGCLNGIFGVIVCSFQAAWHGYRLRRRRLGRRIRRRFCRLKPV